MKKDYVNQVIQHLVKEHETTDPHRLARQMGIQVDEYPFVRIKGMVLEIAGQVTIILNSNLPEWQKRVVLAHELGHLVLSPGSHGYFWIADHTLMESKVEYDAHRFAVELLTWAKEQEMDETLEQYSTRVGIPTAMMIYRGVG